ncbi:RNA polymerase sigma factor [Paenibacillus thermoaerophilus]|uniref:RNA polymerase sigma factor n=1 Tax=Paenibacillus thermoaerophilus TaxID=1215385 RepID=A0ABW2V5P1_9BACL|nr:sigma-70 family RNA polymerase sigma factor [Paenibacillus thermoaerophilus]
MNGDALRELMLAYGQEVWNCAFFLMRRPEMADDITQDVFLKVYRSIGSFQGKPSVKTWLLAITRNTVASDRRSAFIRKAILMDRVIPNRHSPSAEQGALENALRDDIWGLVLRLPVKYREVLILDARYEWNNREIADMLGISEGTVKSRFSRACGKISDMWKEESER